MDVKKASLLLEQENETYARQVLATIASLACGSTSGQQQRLGRQIRQKQMARMLRSLDSS